MTTVELRFPFVGTALPSDQGYMLYSAISHLIPEIHEADWFALETLPGVARGDGITRLDSRSRLRMRLPQERIPLLLKLAGKQLNLNLPRVSSLQQSRNNRIGTIRLGIPEISLLQPSAALYARIVTIKGFTEPEAFIDAVYRKLNERAIRGKVVVGSRRVLQVSNHKIVGFGLVVHQLTDEDSIHLQEKGLGGRRKMGCGYFNPINGFFFEETNE